MSPLLNTTPIFFSTFNVTTQVFHVTALSFALVNLKPLVPGHVLICSRRVTPDFLSLTPAEITDLFLTTQRVSRMIRRVFDAPAINIAIQDGREAGQTVPHNHVHLIPRHRGDFGDRTDRVYEMLEGKEGDVGEALRNWIVDDEKRIPRREKDMVEEAGWLAGEMLKEQVDN